MDDTPTLLAAELVAVRDELPRVDAKCATLASLTMGGIAFLATQVSHGPIAVRVLMAASGLMLTAATLVLLLVVIRPRLGSTGFRAYATATPAAIQQLRTRRARECQETNLVVLSQITNRKFRGLQIATDLTAAAVVLAAAAKFVVGALS